MFLPNVPGATFIQGVMSIPESRVERSVLKILTKVILLIMPPCFKNKAFIN
jgi:hypothetical protein